MAEIDVQLTADHQVVVYHDLTWRGAPVEGTPSAELGGAADLLSTLLAETSGDLNIEIKYKAQQMGVDEWVARILAVVQPSAPRGIVYSSFSREVCEALLAAQQPVLFLSEWLTPEVVDYAAAMDYPGLVTDAAQVLAQPELTAAVKASGFLLATYGRSNNHPEPVLQQLQLGVDTIITDRLKEMQVYLQPRGRDTWEAVGDAPVVGTSGQLAGELPAGDETDEHSTSGEGPSLAPPLLE